MGVKTKVKTSFPSHSVSEKEKMNYEYGMQIANAIESEWFRKDSGSTKYYNSRQRYNDLRLYARGEQSVQKYKDELSINGDLSYLNLDWKPVPIIPKFVDIVVNGIAERTYDIKAYSQDPASTKERTDYMQNVLDDMQAKPFIDQAAAFGVDASSSKMKREELPENK